MGDINPILMVLLLIGGLIGVYTIIRFASLAVFNSYFDAKRNSKRRGEHNGQEN